jgi:EpsI family protein
VTGRAIAVTVLLIAGAVVSGRSGAAESVIPRESLSELPRQLQQWEGVDAEPFRDDVVAQLGVDEYINRRYIRAGSAPIAVYVGYYASQRQGDTIHSPQNCLPGAGWHPIESGRQTIGTGGSAAEVNRYVISKGVDRQVVLYWYQGRGRVIAGEYANKLLLMWDAARLGRTNGGLVRLITPVVTTTDAAGAELAALAGTLLPHLHGYLP